MNLFNIKSFIIRQIGLSPMHLQQLLVYLCKANRSFFSGITAAISIYFYYRNVAYEDPIRIPLTMGCIMLASAVKSALLVHYRSTLGHFNTLILGYIMQLVPLIISNDPNLGIRGRAESFAYLISLGFFPLDGQQFGPFQKIERQYLLQVFREKSLITNFKQYKRLGYVFQAFGSFAFGLYMFLSIEKDYDQKMKVQLTLVFLAFLTLINILLTFLLRKGKGEEIFLSLAQYKTVGNTISSRFSLNIHSFFEGFGYGILVAPFLVYYFDIKLNYYYDDVAKLLCAFFFLKGTGREILTSYISRDFTGLKLVSFTSNIAIAAVAYYTNSSFLSTILLIYAFPFWHLGQVQILDKASHFANSKDSLLFWEKVGGAIGILSVSLSFRINYQKALFAYPFLLCAIVRQINQYSIQFTQKHIPQVHCTLKQQEQMNEYDSQTNIVKTSNKVNQNNNEKQKINCLQTNRIQNKFTRSIGYIIYVIMFFLLVFFYVNTFQDGKFSETFRLMYNRVNAQRPQQLRLYNVSLGDYLSKQNIKLLRLSGCDRDCLQEHHYIQAFAGFNLAAIEPQWLHFPQAPYFTSEAEMQDFFSLLLRFGGDRNGLLKGFSVFWLNPLRYQKIKQELKIKVQQIAQRNGFYYQQMPSLNLRGVQNKIVLVFGRQERKRGALPKFVEKEPPQNLLAFQTTFKMVMNLPEMREFFLYHLRAGVDKFFLYDNDPAHDDPSLFEGNRVTGYFKRCPRFALDQKYQIFQQIWQQFYDHIIYIPWRTSRIASIQVYPQYQAFEHYYLYFREVTRFTTFTDLDEFLYSPSGRYFPQQLLRLESQQDVGTIYILGRPFQFSICNPGKLAIEQTKWASIPFQRQTIKIIIKNSLIVRPSVHGRQAKNGNFLFVNDTLHDLMFIHYQLTTNQLRIVNRTVTQFDIDTSLIPLVQGLKESCSGKCTDSFKSFCSKQQNEQILKEFCSKWP